MKFVLFTLMLVSTHIHAAEWFHIHETQYAVEINIDYKKSVRESSSCFKCDKITVSTPLYFNVMGPLTNGDTKIRVVLTAFKYKDNFRQLVSKSSYFLDLDRRPEGHFSGEFSQTARLVVGDKLMELQGEEKELPIYSSGHFGTFHYVHEVAIVINGHWLQNFMVDFNQGIKL